MLNWRLLRSDSRSTVELWQIPTKYLVCQKYLSLFYIKLARKMPHLQCGTGSILRKFQRSNGLLSENSSER